MKVSELKVDIDVDDLVEKLVNHKLNQPDVIKLKRLSKTVELPKRQTTYSACFDIHCALDHVKDIVFYDESNNKSSVKVKTKNKKEEVILPPKSRALIPTGFVFGIPRNYSLRVQPRSGCSLKLGLTLANSEGIIDRDYLEQTYVMVYNSSTEPLTIQHNSRIAQGDLQPVYENTFEEVEDIEQLGSNRRGGFGHTGEYAKDTFIGNGQTRKRHCDEYS